MTRLPWKTGPAAPGASVFLSATRFSYRSFLSMPAVLTHGLRLRSQWPTLEGAVGMWTAASLYKRTTYTLTAWSSEQDLARWIMSPYHTRLMRDFRGHLESSCVVSWTAPADTASFEPHVAWAEGMQRLRAREGFVASRGAHLEHTRPGAQGKP
ncbi:MAG: hypothetical protein QM778_22335 [Myxococcales bacterium]